MEKVRKNGFPPKFGSNLMALEVRVRLSTTQRWLFLWEVMIMILTGGFLRRK